MSDVGSEISANKPGSFERMASITKEGRPETEGEKLKRLTQLKNSPPNVNSTDNVRDTNPDKNSSEPRGVTPKTNRATIRNELRVLDAQKKYDDMSKKSSIIKAGNYEIGEGILVGGDPKPTVDVPIKSQPDIAPLRDEITPRIQGDQIKKS